MTYNVLSGTLSLYTTTLTHVLKQLVVRDQTPGSLFSAPNIHVFLSC